MAPTRRGGWDGRPARREHHAAGWPGPDLAQGWIGVKLEASVRGLVDITIRDRHGVIAPTAYPLLRSGTQTVPIELTSLGKRDLGTRQAVPITIQASARDLLATTATTSIHATLG